MAIKCPKCGGELVQTTPEIAKCKGCGAAFKKKGAVAKSGGKSGNKQQRKRKEKNKSKKKGGVLKWLIIVIAVVLIGGGGYFVWREIEGNMMTEEITISADFMGEITQEELDNEIKEGHYKSAKVNSDGSVTFSMTKSQHRKILKETEESIKDSLDEMIGSEEYPNFTSVSANKDFTEFKVKTKSEQLDMLESFSIMVFYIYGGMYNGFTGQEVDNISVTFINDKTGDIIDTLNSKDMEGEQESGANTEENETDNMLSTIKTGMSGKYGIIFLILVGIEKPEKILRVLTLISNLLLMDFWNRMH